MDDVVVVTVGHCVYQLDEDRFRLRLREALAALLVHELEQLASRYVLHDQDHVVLPQERVVELHYVRVAELLECLRLLVYFFDSAGMIHYGVV